MPGLTVGGTVPNLEVESTHGKFKIYDYIGHSWAIIFAHPGDFRGVSTTELAEMAAYAEEFDKRGVKVLAISCNDLHSHQDWIKDVEAYRPGCKVSYPIIADPNGDIISQLNMVAPNDKDSHGNHLPYRALLLVGSDMKGVGVQVKLNFVYPESAGHNMEEVMRAVVSLQKVAQQKVMTPVNWEDGDLVAIHPCVPMGRIRAMFPQGYITSNSPSNKCYLRFANIW